MLDHYTTGLTFTLIVIVTCSISIIFKCKVGIRMTHLISYWVPVCFCLHTHPSYRIWPFKRVISTQTFSEIKNYWSCFFHSHRFGHFLREVAFWGGRVDRKLCTFCGACVSACMLEEEVLGRKRCSLQRLRRKVLLIRFSEYQPGKDVLSHLPNIFGGHGVNF